MGFKVTEICGIFSKKDKNNKKKTFVSSYYTSKTSLLYSYWMLKILIMFIANNFIMIWEMSHTHSSHVVVQPDMTGRQCGVCVQSDNEEMFWWSDRKVRCKSRKSQIPEMSQRWHRHHTATPPPSVGLSALQTPNNNHQSQDIYGLAFKPVK